MEGATYRQLAFEFGFHPHNAIELRRRLALPARRKMGRGAPDDISQVIEQIGVSAARQHYSVGWSTLKRWIQQLNIKIDKNKRYKTEVRGPKIPEDWAELAPTMCKMHLARHYRIAHKTVNKIIAATGIEPLKLERKPKPPKPKRALRRNWHNTAYRQFNHQNFTGQAETFTRQAATYLRRIYPNVHRCDILMRVGSSQTWGDVHGVPRKGKGYYRVGPLIMTELEMINHALERGMDG